MRISRSRILKAMMLLVIVFSFIMFVRSVAAVTDPEWQANWYIEADFIGNTPNVNLTVQVWEIVDDVPQSLPPQIVSLNCLVSPAVTLTDDTAVFSGEGGIRCPVPSIQEIVFNMTDGQFRLPAKCACKTGATATAELEFYENVTAFDYPNPLFSLKDLDWAAPISAMNGLRPHMNMTVDTATAVSEDFASTVGSTIGTVTFLPTGDKEYTPTFTANGNGLVSTPALIQQSLAVSNNQTMFYIGYSPATKQTLRGILSSLFVDPGCFGNGTG